MKRFLLIVLLSLSACLGVLAITIPKEHVFIFERSKNSNYVCYDVNLDGDRLNQKEPLRSYWVLGGETRIEELSFLERRVAFGVKVISATESEAVVSLTAYKDLKIRVCKRNGRWVGIVTMNGSEIVLQKMFAQMKAPMHVKCEYVDVTGTDVKTGKLRQERITP